MRRKMLSCVLAIVLILSMATTAMAAQETTKDGLTASEMLIKTSETMNNDYNTFKIKSAVEGDTHVSGTITMKVPDPNNKDQIIEQTQTLDENQKTTATQQGAFEKPQKVYVKTLTSTQDENAQPVESEVFMQDNITYIKVPQEEKWQKLDINPAMQALKELSGGDFVGKPLTKERMELLGQYASFDEDITLNGKSYHVIHVKMNPEALKKITTTVIEKMMDSVNVDVDNEEIKASRAKILESIENMNQDTSYQYYVNPKNYTIEYMHIDQNISMDLGDVHTQVHQTIQSQYYDFNEPVTFPTISEENVKDLLQ